jgi:predicted HTH transcriptional regulator
VDLRDLKKIVQKGESETVEFKKSTGQLRRTGETLCAMLNGRGGRVLIGITSEGNMIGQQISDKTLRDIAEELAKFEPPSRIEIERLEVKPGREIIVLSARPNDETMPCVFAGHPEPEFMEESGAFCVRFLPSGYIAPHRVAHDLTERQREILQILSTAPWLTFGEIRAGLKHFRSERSIRNDLMHLRSLGLASLDGRGRGAKWALIRMKEE